MALTLKGPRTFSQLAELHVSGLFAEDGWLVYFPHRDDGFDFIAMKQVSGEYLIRPVQVKGKYPTEFKKDNQLGFIGKLTRRHPEMVLAIPYFEVGDIPRIQHVAFMPAAMIRTDARGERCLPAFFQRGHIKPRPKYKKFFDNEGLKRASRLDWKKETIDIDLDDQHEEDRE